MMEVKVTDASVIDAFNRLIDLGEDPSGVLMAFGEEMLTFTKERFNQSCDPYGVPWEPLKTRDGKPLVGESKSLSTQFAYRLVDNDTVTLSSLMQYAAMQNFGGTVTAKNAQALFFMIGSRKVFVKSVTIPARQFFPDAERGLPDELSANFSDVLRTALQGAWDGT